MDATLWLGTYMKTYTLYKTVANNLQDLHKHLPFNLSVYLAGDGGLTTPEMILESFESGERIIDAKALVS